MQEVSDKVAMKKAEYRALVNATRPFSRTARQQEEIDRAYFAWISAIDWAWLESLEARDRYLMRKDHV